MEIKNLYVVESQAVFQNKIVSQQFVVASPHFKAIAVCIGPGECYLIPTNRPKQKLI